VDPTKTKEELLEELKQTIDLVSDFLNERNAPLDAIINASGFERNKAIVVAKEAVNENDETRKKFEVMCREVFIKFKACLTIPDVNNYRNHYDKADISDIIKQLHEVIDESITVIPGKFKEPNKPHDISKINFERLRAEFECTKIKNTVVQSLKSVIEKKLERLIQRNPLRTDFQEHYEKIINEYNKEKDRQNIEETFEALLKFVQGLDEEESRAVREGLDEETLAIYDLLAKSDLKPKEIQKIKKVAKELLKTLKERLTNMYRFQDKETTRDAVKVLIRDFLWDEKTGLPVEYYTQKDVYKKAEAVFYHVFRAYPTVPSPYYASAAS
jgi:type I restriction enzyme R subunit